MHARSSYNDEEIVWKARFVNMLGRSPEGKINVDLRKISDYESPVANPAESLS